MTSLTRASLKNRLLVGLITAAVALFGLISMGALKQELMPSMSAPMAFVMIDSEGLAPEEMSRTVTEPAEKALMAVPGVKNVTSTTSSGSAQLQVEWTFGKDDDETMRTIKAAVDGLKAVLPKDANSQVFSGGTDGIPAMMISAGSSKEDSDFGEALAQTVVPALQGVSGVQRVELAGRAEQQLMIDLRPADVTRLKVQTEMIPAALQAYGTPQPAGSAASKEGKIAVTVGEGLTSVEAIQALPFATQDGVVRLSDFADVHLETVPQGSISRVNGKDALTLQIMPAQGANVVDISHGVNAELERLSGTLKADFVTVFDQAPFIEQSIHDLSVEGGLGLLFAVLVILAFLGSWRSTIIAAVSIPLSLLITLIGLLWSGNTLNILTLGALTIAIGRVVDDSIVVIENISRRRGSGPLTIEAVVASVRQVAGAITASTLTTVAVFLPIAFVSGMAGQLFRPFAITVTIALLASLVVALTVVPVLAFWFMRNRPAKGHGAEAAADEADPEDDLAEIHTAPDRLQKAVMPVLGATRRHPAITITVSILLLVATLGMSSFIRTDFLGSTGAESLQLVQTPPKSAEGDLIEAAKPVERALADVDGVRDVLTNIPIASSGVATEITYEVMLADGADTEQTSNKIEKAMERVRDIGEVQLLTQDSYTGGAGGGISLQIQGNDPKALREAGEALEKKLKGEKGVQSVRSELAGEQPVVRVKVDEAKAAKIGYDPTTVAQAIRSALEGQAVGQLMLDGRDRSVVVRTPGTERTADALATLMLPVTPQQTAEAQKLAGDRLTEQAKEQAQRAQDKAASEMSSQISDAYAARDAMNAQIAELTAQLQALNATPVDPGPFKPDNNEDAEAMKKALAARAEQVAGLQGAIAAAQQGIEGINEQISALNSARGEASNALAEQEKAEAEQKAALEATGTAVPLSAIAEVTEELTAPTITRANGDRQVALSVTPKKGQLDAANLAVQNAIETVDLPAGVSFELGGVSAEQDEAFTQLGGAMLGAILLVLLVMVATFRSFRGPFVLLVSIPFAATGALLGLLLTGTALGLPAMIGLLMLIGIVVTNAIVLMDLINRLREAGASLDEAVEHGTRLRLRPILMTAAATIFALVPMSLGLTGGGVFISKPLAIVVIGGLISSTLLTLILVPILYTWVERRYLRKTQKRSERRERRAEKKAAKAGLLVTPALDPAVELGIDPSDAPTAPLYGDGSTGGEHAADEPGGKPAN
ncbi:efflux RND transporter permease subunit [Leucobacter sp. UT-8R-CII-1-4]|uniref:efflux RND transporter permease subunit n=1 Tax=Leucobacter sp. UT-8R-CII-1-4 TaxID=3040075 RepID=UPI0024A87FCE|nr:efflux RND transporter permease subunit [Leucobacter sp. UT-8R-CII-1-4]MDI6023533.1 efflux RND transporter permease subunit [Leucobacter sp. UT-8R-CII-1-4]